MSALFSVVYCLCCVVAGVLAGKGSGIPITIEEPKGYKSAGLRLHLAHFGSVPYGEVFPRARVHSFDDDCMCGSVPCNTGCGDFNEATPQERCKPRIVQQGGLSETEVNAILVEEGDDNTCTRSTVAYNAARAYADAVIIIAKRGERHLVASVHSKSAVSQTETLQLEHVNIPIGVVTHADGGTIKKAIAEAEGNIFLKMDFRWLLPKNNAGTTIQIWHTTDDDCGPACVHTEQFLYDIADLAQTLGPNDPITIEPHFLFANCTNSEQVGDEGNTYFADAEMCKRSCVNNNRYCYERFTNLELYGSLIAEENIRQLCLFDTLRNTPSRDTRKYWIYKKYFMQNCRTQEKNFNAACSERAFDTLAERGEIKEKWQKCFQDLGGSKQIRPAESEIKDMAKEEISAWLGSIVLVGQEHFRGSLDLPHVMKAACDSMTEDLRNSTSQCAEWTYGVCRPGSQADRDCRNPWKASEHRTQCKEMAASPGFRCECDAGYEIVPSAAGGGKCVDMNECELFPTLCNRGDLSRNACLNTDGAFECEEDLPDQCTAENNFGECWNEEDQFTAYKASLQNGERLQRLHKCDCESIRGCWVGGAGDCERMCPEGDCHPLTKQCRPGGFGGGDDNERGEAVAAALGVTGALLAAVGAGVLFLIVRKKQKQKAMDDAPGATGGGAGGATEAASDHYDNEFDTGFGTSERMSTGAIAMGGIRDLYPTGPPAGALAKNKPKKGKKSAGTVAAGAAAYVAQAGGSKQPSAFAPEIVQKEGEEQMQDVSLQNSSLHVQEHPES